MLHPGVARGVSTSGPRAHPPHMWLKHGWLDHPTTICGSSLCSNPAQRCSSLWLKQKTVAQALWLELFRRSSAYGLSAIPGSNSVQASVACPARDVRAGPSVPPGFRWCDRRVCCCTLRARRDPGKTGGIVAAGVGGESVIATRPPGFGWCDRCAASRWHRPPGFRWCDLGTAAGGAGMESGAVAAHRL